MTKIVLAELNRANFSAACDSEQPLFLQCSLRDQNEGKISWINLKNKDTFKFGNGECRPCRICAITVSLIVSRSFCQFHSK